jgi:ABC-2 type transport system permease protein
MVKRVRTWLLWPMLWKEFIQMRRDKFTFALLLGLPILELILFGYAIQMEARHLPTVVLDESQTQESRALISVLEQTQYFDIVRHAGSRADLKTEIQSGKARAAIVIPPDFAQDIKRGRTAAAQVIVDAADPLSSQSAISGAALASSVYSKELLRIGTRGRDPPLDVRVRPWYNPALKSPVYIVPGIIGLLLTLTLLVITAMAIVREREAGTLEQLIVTPIGKVSMMLGKLLPFVIVGYIQMTSVLILGGILFGVPMRGSLLLLYFLTFGFISANLALGMLVSTIARSQAQAIQMSIFFLLPSVLLSGFMFPRDAMPVLAQWIGALLPLTHFLLILRGILLKGIGIESLWREGLILFGTATVLIALSVRKFSKTLE